MDSSDKATVDGAKDAMPDDQQERLR
jgi:hypothetical protein